MATTSPRDDNRRRHTRLNQRNKNAIKNGKDRYAAPVTTVLQTSSAAFERITIKFALLRLRLPFYVVGSGMAVRPLFKFIGLLRTRPGNKSNDCNIIYTRCFSLQGESD